MSSASMTSISALLLLLQIGSAAAFHIHLSHNNSVGLLHDTVNISCGLDRADSEVKNVEFINLRKGGQTIVVFRHDSQPHVTDDGLKSKYRAIGNITTPSASYLNVTILNSSFNDSGEYSCQFYYSNQMDILKETIKGEFLNETMVATIKYLVKEVARLKNQSFCKDVEIKKLQRRAVHQEKRQTMVENTEMFTATHTTKEVLVTGNVLVFNDVISNEGQYYNGSTGIFTVPFTGMYMFQLAIEVPGKHSATVLIQTSSGKRLTIVRAGDPSGGSEDFTSRIIFAKLDAGEQVKPIITVAVNKPRLSGDSSNQFSAILMKAA